MGAWGPGLFQDDTACDVRDAFDDLIADGMTAADATAELVRQWEPSAADPEISGVFWIALAAAQYRQGRLVDQVQERAVTIIDSGDDLLRFFDQPGLRLKRGKILEDLKHRLLGPQRKPKKITPTVRHFNAWEIGDILAYRLRSGRLALFRVAGHHEDKGGKHAWVEVLQGVYTTLPGEFTIAHLPARFDFDGRLFRLFVLPEYEQSDRLAMTQRGHSLIARVAHKLRDRPLVSGMYSRILTQQGIDEALSRWLGLS